MLKIILKCIYAYRFELALEGNKWFFKTKKETIVGAGVTMLDGSEKKLQTFMDNLGGIMWGM